MIYEQRIYRVASGKRRGFINFFGETVMPLLTRHGTKIIGVWETLIGERCDVVVLMAYPDMTERMKAWDAFEADKSWKQHTEGLPQDSVMVSILKPTSYSPMQ
jgi:hypothetical protein